MGLDGNAYEEGRTPPYHLHAVWPGIASAMSARAMTETTPFEHA